MAKSKTLTIIMNAFNEEKNIALSIENVTKALNELVDDYEVLVFNDGSSDQTGAIADSLAEQNSKVKVTHYAKNRGVAQIARDAIKQASMKYLTWFPGDNSLNERSLIPIVKSIGQEDIIVAYIDDMKKRPFKRRVYSSGFTTLMNLLFGLDIKYYNGATVYPVEMIKKIRIASYGHSYLAEILIRCIQQGYTYKQVAFENNVGTDSYSKSVHMKNVFNAFKVMGILFNDVYIKRNPTGVYS